MTGRAILITGGARRVGLGLVRHFLGLGWHVVAHSNATAPDPAALGPDASHGSSGGLSIVRGDLRDPEACTSVLHQAADAAGETLSALVNNASVYEHDRARTLDPAVFWQNMAVNLLAPLLLTKAFHEAVAGRGGRGVVVNILDQKVFSPSPDFLSYTLSKTGLLAATRMLALDLAPAVRVNGVAPGLTLRSGSQTDEEFRRHFADTPLGRGGTVDEIAAAVQFLVEAEAVTGEVITVDGGRHLRGIRSVRDFPDLGPARKD